MAKFTLQTPKPQPQTAEPEVDPAALEAFAAGAKERRVAEGDLPPWERFDPNAKPKHNVSVRLNDYEIEMLRYLSEIQEISQHKILHKQLIPVLKQMAIEEFEARRSK